MMLIRTSTSSVSAVMAEKLVMMSFDLIREYSLPI